MVRNQKKFGNRWFNSSVRYLLVSPGRPHLFVYISVHLIRHHLIRQFAQSVTSLYSLEAFWLSNMPFAVLLLMSKQLVHVGIQTNYGWYSESWIESWIEAILGLDLISYQKVQSNPESSNRGSKLEPQSWGEICFRKSDRCSIRVWKLLLSESILILLSGWIEHWIRMPAGPAINWDCHACALDAWR